MSDAKVVGEALLKIHKLTRQYYNSPSDANVILGDIWREAAKVVFSAARLAGKDVLTNDDW